MELNLTKGKENLIKIVDEGEDEKIAYWENRLSCDGWFLYKRETGHGVILLHFERQDTSEYWYLSYGEGKEFGPFCTKKYLLEAFEVIHKDEKIHEIWYGPLIRKNRFERILEEKEERDSGEEVLSEANLFQNRQDRLKAEMDELMRGYQDVLPLLGHEYQYQNQNYQFTHAQPIWITENGINSAGQYRQNLIYTNNTAAANTNYGSPCYGDNLVYQNDQNFVAAAGSSSQSFYANQLGQPYSSSPNLHTHVLGKDESEFEEISSLWNTGE